MKSFFFCFVLGWIIPDMLAQTPMAIDPQQIQIARDKWGVPHIFAPTNAQVAYGLAWANAEDSFKEMQEMMLITSGFMGRYKGIEGAGFDFFVHAIDIERTYHAHIGELSADFLVYLDGYAQGINAYAAAHPQEVLYAQLFPVHTKALLQTYVIAFSALGGAADQVQRIVGGKYDALPTPVQPKGSNAYAFAADKTTNGKTFLAINPHFQVSGSFSFYEAHLCSEEGLNITGALFQGGTSVFMGNNRHLGWGQTYNYLDLVDVFRLKMHPHKKGYYEWDGEWKKLEQRPVWLKVRLGGKSGDKGQRGGIVLPVRKMTYWSVYGPTLRSPDKQFYALRSPSFFTLRYPEQYYRMNLATNFETFQSALDINSLTMFNIVYADKDNHIMYLCNGKMPRRNPDYDFHHVLSGHQSDNLWTEYYTWQELPQSIDPACGFVVNTNNTPTRATCEAGDESQRGVLHYTDMRPGQNNRALRFLELAEAQDTCSFEYFKQIKFDVQTSSQSPFFASIRRLSQQIPPEKYPHIADLLQRLYTWDGNASPESTDATLWILALDHLFVQLHLSDDVFIHGLPDIADSVFVRGVEIGKDFLMRHYQSTQVPLGKLHVLHRNGKNHSAPGFPDVLSPMYGKKSESDDTFRALYADTYIHFVQFGKEGAEQIETLLPFDLSRHCEDYVDELEMMRRQTLKPMSLDKATILRDAIKIYPPK